MEHRIIANRYRLIEVIGSGGMAEVYKAFDTLLNRDVAVKLLRPQYTDDAGFISRFKQEAQSAARLIHPNIVNIYDVGLDGELHYIVMEYVKGRTLKDLIAEEGPLDPFTAVIIAHGIASALKHAHANGIIHCDIKPHNILLDESNNPKVTDFGIARAISTATITYTSAVVGSVHYLSPEQVRGEKVSAQSDIYSLGILLFEMLTGQLPYNGDTPVAVALMHVQERMPLLREIKSDLPLILEKIVAKALCKDKSERYHDADELLRDLEYSIDVLTGSDEYSEKIRKFAAEDFLTKQELNMEDTIRIDRAAYANQLEDKKPLSFLKKLLANKLLRRWVLPILVIASFGVIGMFVFGDLGGPEVVVPDVTGKTILEAETTLKNAKLNFTIDEEYDPKVVPGTVISQNPGPKRMVKEGRKVLLVVSKGVELGDVPELRGKKLTEVKALLKETNFELGNISYRYLSGAPEETVLEQSIAPPAKLPVGTKLDIVLNIKNNQVVMPDFNGVNLKAVKDKLQELGLTLGTINYVENKEQPNDTVLSTNPALEEVVNRGDTINLNVVKNPVEKVKPSEAHYVEFIVPEGSSRQEVKIVVVDDHGSRIAYQNSHKAGVRLRQRVEGSGNIKVQFYSNEKLIEEKNL
ncbi:MAG TPA: Stk1 family PASTA domain-containing Ser/Thr kinase [Candidatus Avacidaminococcus intestinavium]|uniref:non-specific serine/threonine protein kinase n=1 Tax=Candidatus Avacidaminococcus intestinavium TaxID=2840684 RepID=A0A9D1MP28_9FIRM|nr:Stk1 family PASTA domain-containing Ser/Thr kinase [Candidatus Avacidaminococcus intestinavium]